MDGVKINVVLGSTYLVLRKSKKIVLNSKTIVIVVNLKAFENNEVP